MKSSELRVGNWVNNNEEDYQITSATIVQLERGDSTAKPIDITYEWLLKLGFTYIHGDNDYHIYASPEHDYYLQMDARRNNGEYVILDNTLLGDLRSFASTSIKYVHQLQNLYFALTGIELEIKR